MAVSGYCISDLIENRAFLKKNREAVEKIAAQAKGIVAVVGFVDFDASKVNEDGTFRKYNAAAVLQDGKILAAAHKTLLPNYRYFDDKRYFSPGEKERPFRLIWKTESKNSGLPSVKTCGTTATA